MQWFIIYCWKLIFMFNFMFLETDVGIYYSYWYSVAFLFTITQIISSIDYNFKS